MRFRTTCWPRFVSYSTSARSALPRSLPTVWWWPVRAPTVTGFGIRFGRRTRSVSRTLFGWRGVSRWLIPRRIIPALRWIRGLTSCWLNELVLRLPAVVNLVEFAVVLVRPNGLFTKTRQDHPGFHVGSGLDLVQAHQDLIRLMAGDRGPGSG